MGYALAARQKQNLVRESLTELQNDVGCIKFTESTNGHYVDVHSTRGRGCYAMIGMTGGNNQFLNLDDSQMCMGNKGIIKHEFIHALGFMHTHMRTDRDKHIRVNWNLVMSNRKKLNCIHFEYHCPRMFQLCDLPGVCNGRALRNK